ncbi:TPA: hypothetical protein ACPVXB_005071 [Vibrio parahaemolyticus]
MSYRGLEQLKSLLEMDYKNRREVSELEIWKPMIDYPEPTKSEIQRVKDLVVATASIKFPFGNQQQYINKTVANGLNTLITLDRRIQLKIKRSILANQPMQLPSKVKHGKDPYKYSGRTYSVEELTQLLESSGLSIDQINPRKTTPKSPLSCKGGLHESNN